MKRGSEEGASQIRMRSSLVARGIARLYRGVPFRRYLLKLIAALEGGQMTSTTLRRLLREFHGVEVGPFAYGSLLELGMADRSTTIGPYASIGPNVRRIGAAHSMDAPFMHPYWYNSSLGMVSVDRDVPRTSCEIGADVWIGANVTILPSCGRIGLGAVIGANAVVTRDVPDFGVVVGVPARLVYTRLDPEMRARLLSIADWSTPPVALAEQLRATLRDRADMQSSAE